MSSVRATTPTCSHVADLLASDFLVRAYDVAEYSHEGQFRTTPTGKIPYILHPLAVFNHLRAWGATDERLLAAALLHDTIEDAPERVREYLLTNFTEDIPLYTTRTPAGALVCLGRVFGPVVERTVRGLTNDPDVPYLDHVRDAIADPFVLAVKLADFRDNALSLKRDHPRYEKLRAKYEPLAPVLAGALEASAVARALIPEHRLLLRALREF